MNKTILKSAVITLFGTALLAGSAFGAAFNDRTPPISPINTVGETSLQGILDDFAGVGVIDAVDDQREEAVWERSGDFDSLVVRVALYIADEQSEIGIYSFNDSSKKVPFSSIDAVGDSISFNIQADGDLFVDDVLAFAGFGQAFGFYITNNSAYYYTEDEENGGDHRALVYNLEGVDYTIAGFPATGEVDDWLLAFNEGSDYDFNDAVYFIEDISPIPEPATMLLFGAGLAGLAGVARRRKK